MNSKEYSDNLGELFGKFRSVAFLGGLFIAAGGLLTPQFLPSIVVIAVSICMVGTFLTLLARDVPAVRRWILAMFVPSHRKANQGESWASSEAALAGAVSAESELAKMVAQARHNLDPIGFVIFTTVMTQHAKSYLRRSGRTEAGARSLEELLSEMPGQENIITTEGPSVTWEKLGGVEDIQQQQGK
jgi:hypothetical protein